MAYVASLSHSHPNSAKTDVTVVNIYLQYIYATFGEFLTLITDNGKEFKKELFQKVASELSTNTNFQVLTAHNPMTF